MTQSLLDAAAGPLALWRFVARLGLGEQAEDGRAEEKDTVSLRDRYSTEEVTDMHALVVGTVVQHGGDALANAIAGWLS